MSNLEELDKLNDNLLENTTLLKENAGLIDSNVIINLVLSTYLPSIAKSLAIIADKMSEEKKEEK